MSIWIISLFILFWLLQIEVIFLFVKVADINKKITITNKYFLDFINNSLKKIDEILDIEDGTKDIDKMLNDMLAGDDFSSGYNPYQE